MKFPRELGAEAGGYPREEMGHQDSPEVWGLRAGSPYIL